MFLINVAVDFLDCSLDEFGGIVLLQGLMQVHDVPHHFSMECYGVPHTFLNFKLIIMMSIIVIPKEQQVCLLWQSSKKGLN